MGQKVYHQTQSLEQVLRSGRGQGTGIYIRATGASYLCTPNPGPRGVVFGSYIGWPSEGHQGSPDPGPSPAACFGARLLHRAPALSSHLSALTWPSQTAALLLKAAGYGRGGWRRRAKPRPTTENAQRHGLPLEYIDLLSVPFSECLAQ